MPETIARLDLELLRGAVDIHIHHGPDLYDRIQDPIELAAAARDAGMRAICIKRHNFPTPALAAMAHKAVPEVDVFGSLACNREVGGLNPLAVEAAIKYGVRQIWLPTIDSTNHEVVTGSRGQHGVGLTIRGGLSKYSAEQPRIDLFDGSGALRPEVVLIVEQVVAADIILNLGHTSFNEMIAVAEKARGMGARRVVCDHPFFLRLGVDQQLALADRGVWINFTAGELLPRWWRASVGDFAAAIRAVGVARSIVSSDCGQLHNPPMTEALRMTGQLLLEEGFGADEIRTLLQHNPARLLYP